MLLRNIAGLDAVRQNTGRGSRRALGISTGGVAFRLLGCRVGRRDTLPETASNVSEITDRAWRIVNVEHFGIWPRGWCAGCR